MKSRFFQFLILILFLWSGFFSFTKMAQAIYATTVNPVYSGYNFRDVWGPFVSEEKFWFDGEHFRFSFTPTRSFYTSWGHYGDLIKKINPYSVFLSTTYFFENGGGGGTGTYFVENLSDLNGYKRGDGIYFLWEKDHRYDTYVIHGDILATGLTESNFFLNSWLKTYPGIKLNPKYSHVDFKIRYDDYVNNSHRWNYIDYSYTSVPAKPDPVIIVPGMLGSWNFGFGWELDPILNTYDNLWSALEEAGYEKDKTLFSFPYNWRLSNVYNAIELKDKINEVKAICQCNKVDIVGHSMGGLVARAYVEMGNYENDIDQLIFLAVPHKGSSKAYLTWEGGEFGIDKLDLMRNRIFKVEAELNGYGSVYDYIHQLPMKSIEEVLPIYDYLKDKDIDNKWQIRNYPDNYPRNLFLELLNEPSQLAKLGDIDITNIISDSGASSTHSYLKVIKKDFIDGQWRDGYPEGFYSIFGDHGIEYGPGDGTVPHRSNSKFNNVNDIMVTSSHNNVVTDAQKIIIKELTGLEPIVEYRKNIFSKYLMIRIFSPADFVVTAPNGQRVGKDFISGQAIIEIDGAFYSGFNYGPEFVLIPDPSDGEYQIELLGTGNGAYKLSASLIGDDVAVDSDYDGIISLNDTDNYSLEITTNGLSTLDPDIETITELEEQVAEMYQQGWLNHFGSKNALLSQIKNGFKNESQFSSLNKFLLNMLEKERINQQSYDIIESALINIKNNL